MFKVGSIRKIDVKDFVTYSYVEMYPGANLNMLIGPNGTGKSTIVAAIILGLGGNPKIVGRGSKVSEYVKHNCDQATINIYLQGERGDDFIKVTRIFTTQDKTTWFLNNQRCHLKEVLECTKQYNIQVDNLCQFLPQDRVQDFAKLNQQQLLKETQVALCRTDLVEKQQALIECRENHKNLSQAIEKNSAKLQENQDANVRLEGKIENSLKKRKFMDRMQDIERKVSWLEYDQYYERMVEVKSDLTKATQMYEKHKNAAKPVEREIQQAKNRVSELQNSNSNVTRSLHEQQNSLKNYMNAVDQTKDKVRDIERETEEKIAVIEQERKEGDNMAAKIQEMKAMQQKILEQYGNDEEVVKKVTKLTTDREKFKRHATGLQNRKEELITSKQTKNAELRGYEHERTRLENVKQQRLQYLERVNRDAYEGVLWLRDNKHLFEEEVYEPIILELNVLDPKNAIYLENVIAFRDRVAFVCVNKNDMNKLIRHLRVERKLTINVLYAGDRNQVFHPTIPIEQLRKYGLYAYLHSLIQAPDGIMAYLCRTYRLHNIPVGNKNTSQCFEDVPSQITVFFSDSIRYSVNYSKYSHTKSIKQNEIQSDGSLSVCLDVLRLEHLEGLIQNLKIGFATCDNETKELDTQINLISEKISNLDEELKHVKSAKQQVQAIEDRIVAMQRRLEDMRRRSGSNDDEIRAQARTRIKRVIRGMRQLALDIKATNKALLALRVKSNLNNVKIERARSAAAYLENKNEEARRLMRESEATMNNVRETYGDVKAQAKAALHKAKALSRNFTPDDEGFGEFRQVFEALSTDFGVLEEEKRQLAAKIECLNTADDGEMQQYEERLQNIKSLQESIDKANVNLTKMAARMDQMESDWLTPLRQLVAEINANFGTFFERMGCAGEVSINTGDDVKEFSKYGLCIKVTYRNGEPLQELNNVVQSGGERAVATAVFMMALQELTPVPFRCVDEINQGMDAINERRIFDLLVETTSENGRSQYFLVTPKILPNLSYSRNTMVHFVHNGPFVEADRKWPMSRLCNPQGVQMH